ncbi:pentatricopeptide repeat-containing protein At4g21065-like [Humulus lupulus]|uniref:pentatricopeptide repeat-containing protein At4g21065-like n=1 Tax=Humulus lupulus TaxID=3486 RepID=UPI002B412AC9|nr:pentatricopeptide repeat-containing protein At4g21065-like [Humulus lupulus]
MRVLRQIHAHVLTRFLPISALSFALSKIAAFCSLSPIGDISYARRVFSRIPYPNIFCWNSMIRGCSQIENPSKESILFFKKLTQKGYPGPNTFTLAFVLKACSVVLASDEGQQVHSRVFRSGFGSSSFVQMALLNMYAKFEDVWLAHLVFDEITEKDLVAWSAMISAYLRAGLVDETFGLFRKMQMAGVVPDQVTMGSVVMACAWAGSLDIGRWAHAYIEKQMIDIDLELGTALVYMYARCGCIEKAKAIFNKLSVKDTKAWSSMIAGLSIHGLHEEALKHFAMMEASKVKPDHLTFTSILSAYGHCGLVSEGRRFWSHMIESGIKPSTEHYGCMVDLLCRAGLVNEACFLVKNTTLSLNPVIWRSLLVGCEKNKLLVKGELIAECLLQLEPRNADNYILLSSLYASVLQWEKMRLVRMQMKERRIKPIPAYSSIEIGGIVHEFKIGDSSHPNAKEVKEVLGDISVRIRETGYKPSVTEILHRVVDEEKENTYGEHSEKLAVAYGLWKTKAPAVIRIVNNHRICGDCHEVMKIISKSFEREIIVRDRVRFHKFVDGSCTCKDYW